MMSNTQQTGGSGLSWGWAAIIVALLLTMGGIGAIFYFGRKKDGDDKKADGDSDTQTDILGNVVEYAKDLVGSLSVEEAAEKGIAIFPQPADYYEQKPSTVLGPVSVPDTAGWPLKRVFGSELHKVNPYVKDVQQYFVNAKGAQIDIDGAFGGDTEAAAQKYFGSKTISKQTYNGIIAPYLGKPAAA